MYTVGVSVSIRRLCRSKGQYHLLGLHAELPILVAGTVAAGEFGEDQFVDLGFDDRGWGVIERAGLLECFGLLLTERLTGALWHVIEYTLGEAAAMGLIFENQLAFLGLHMLALH